MGSFYWTNPFTTMRGDKTAILPLNQVTLDNCFVFVYTVDDRWCLSLIFVLGV